MRAKKVQIMCKASGRRSRFRLIYRVDYNDIFRVNKPSIKTCLQSQCSNLGSPRVETMMLNHPPPWAPSFFFFVFFFSSLCSLLPPHFPAVAFRWASMYHISLCFSCVALFGPEVRGWNKADPHFEADRVSKVWTWGQHLPSLPA